MADVMGFLTKNHHQFRLESIHINYPPTSILHNMLKGFAPITHSYPTFIGWLLTTLVLEVRRAMRMLRALIGIGLIGLYEVLGMGTLFIGCKLRLLNHQRQEQMTIGCLSKGCIKQFMLF